MSELDPFGLHRYKYPSGPLKARAPWRHVDHLVDVDSQQVTYLHGWIWSNHVSHWQYVLIDMFKSASHPKGQNQTDLPDNDAAKSAVSEPFKLCDAVFSVRADASPECRDALPVRGDDRLEIKKKILA